uniref:uncharacterized protein LOC122585821 n=1 Tax=Erigeron canadensis TaxID=72917 RepID=UPI001CB8E183|nr:uncharacterized protein LOC122585821 [Erigeron canadensis]XP_043613881.1 uncharacterized protein LOC122585821 [Erigeron canadensis]
MGSVMCMMTRMSVFSHCRLPCISVQGVFKVKKTLEDILHAFLFTCEFMDCGELRASSCSCSDVSSYRNSSSNFDVGSMGRLSFLIENEKGDQNTIFSHMKGKKQSGTGDLIMLKRSNSCVVHVKKSIGFWKIGKLFKKKTEKDCFDERNRDGLELDQKSDMDVSRSRSRSLSSFMDGNFESAKVSDFNDFEPRKSGFVGGLMDLDDDGDDSNYDDDEFIDLKIDLCDKLKTECSVLKKDDSLELNNGCGIGSSSCRFSVSDRGIKKVKNSHVKGWKWIFKPHSGKKDVDHILES